MILFLFLDTWRVKWMIYEQSLTMIHVGVSKRYFFFRTNKPLSRITKAFGSLSELRHSNSASLTLWCWQLLHTIKLHFSVGYFEIKTNRHNFVSNSFSFFGFILLFFFPFFFVCFLLFKRKNIRWQGQDRFGVSRSQICSVMQ